MESFVSMIFALLGGCAVGQFVKKRELCWAGFGVVCVVFNVALALGFKVNG